MQCSTIALFSSDFSLLLAAWYTSYFHGLFLVLFYDLRSFIVIVLFTLSILAICPYLYNILNKLHSKNSYIYLYRKYSRMKFSTYYSTNSQIYYLFLIKLIVYSMILYFIHKRWKLRRSFLRQNFLRIDFLFAWYAGVEFMDVLKKCNVFHFLTQDKSRLTVDLNPKKSAI